MQLSAAKLAVPSYLR